MTDSSTDPKHFTKAVTDLGEKRPVVTTQAIFNEAGIKILEKGVAVNAGLYERLMTHRLTVPIENSVTSTPSVGAEIFLEHAGQALQDIPFFQRIGSDAATRAILLDTLETLSLPPPLIFQLTLAHEVRPALFQHSIQMALFAAWMMTGPLAVRFDISLAATAGLLHDLGMLHLDPILLSPTSAIYHNQRRQLYSHALVSTILIERHHEFPGELLRAIREHHEFLDGSGYPSSLSGQAISPLGRVLALGELVTSVLTRPTEGNELRLSVLLRMNSQRYDAPMVERVLARLQPHGEVQKLANGDQPDPVKQLIEINATLSSWPAQFMSNQNLSAPRREGMEAVVRQLAQLTRTLAGVGAAPEQLKQLGNVSQDLLLQSELQLFAREASWQLRLLARQAQLRWQRATDTGYPEALQTWLKRVDAIVGQSLNDTTPD